MSLAWRSPGLRRGAAGLAAATATLLTPAGVLAAPAADGAAARSTGSQPLVILLRPHVVRTLPSVTGRRVKTVAARRPLTGVRTVLPVLGEARDAAGRGWLHVRLPGRPNEHSGWIPSKHTRRQTTGWRLTVDLSARRVTATFAGRVERRFKAIVGAAATPTPRGSFFVEEPVALSSADSGAPFALATSARSQVYQEFDGGPGQIALHGTGNLAGTLGTAASHGCVRLSPRAITWLVRRVGRGVPVTIKG